MSTRSLALPLVLSFLSAFALVQRADAQTSAPWIELRARYLGASDDMGRTPLVDQSVAILVNGVEGVPSLGLGLGYALSDRVALRLTVDRSLYAAATGHMMCAPSVTCTTGFQTVPVHVRRWEAGVDAQLRSKAEWLPFSTVLSAGVGALRTQTAWWQGSQGYSGYSDYSEAERSIDVSLVFRAGVGAERKVGSVDLFLETAATAATLGEPAQQFIEGAFPDSRQTRVHLSLSGGVRYELR